MFGCSPPLTMIPCTRASGRSCWRIWSRPTKSWITALSALTPRQGQDEAWVALPWNSAVALTMPRLGRHTCVPQRPWIIIAASTSLKTPASSSFTLPAPPSSAGVPVPRVGPGEGRGPRGGRGGGGGPADSALDLGPMPGEELGQPAVRLVLLEAELGRGVDPVRERLQ